MVHVFALAGPDGFDPRTSVPMLKEAIMRRFLLDIKEHEVDELICFSTTLRRQLYEYIHTMALHDDDGEDDEGEEWDDWTDDEPKDENILLTDLKRDMEKEIDVFLACLSECGSIQSQLKDAPHPVSLLSTLCRQLCGSTDETDIPLTHIVDTSEQMTRAGIDFLKTGFSRMGFGGKASASNGHVTSVMDTSIVVIFVLGGITYAEVAEMGAAWTLTVQLIVVSTSWCNGTVILKQLLRQV